MKHLSPSVLILAGTILILCGHVLFGMLVFWGGVWLYNERNP